MLRLRINGDKVLTEMPALQYRAKDIEKAILDGIRNELPDLRAEYVRLVSDRDQDDAEVLEVHVVLNNEKPSLNDILASKRKLRQLLLKVGVEAYPIFRFHSPSDARNLDIGY